MPDQNDDQKQPFDWKRLLISGVLGGLAGGPAGNAGMAQQAGRSIGTMMNYRRRKPIVPGQQPQQTQDPNQQGNFPGGYIDPSYDNPMQMQAPQPFRDGGIVDKPTYAVLGEDGPEMVIPLTDRKDNRVPSYTAARMCYRR